MGCPRGVDIVFLLGVCAAGDTHHFCRQCNISLFSSDDLLTKFLLTTAFLLVLHVVQPVYGVHVFGDAAVFVVCQQGAFTKACHQLHQGLTCRLIEGFELFLLQLFQIAAPVGHHLVLVLLFGQRSEYGGRKFHQLEGVLLFQTGLVAQHDGAPLTVPGHGLLQMGDRVGQRVFLRPPLAELHTGIVDKGLQKYLVLLNVVNMFFFRDHNSEQFIHLRFPGSEGAALV